MAGAIGFDLKGLRFPFSLGWRAERGVHHLSTGHREACFRHGAEVRVRLEETIAFQTCLLLMAVEPPHEPAIAILPNHPRDDHPIAIQPATLLRFRLDVDGMPDQL